MFEGVLQGSGAGGNSFGVGEVGYSPPHGPGPGGGSEQGIQINYREASPAASGRKFGVPTFGDDNEGGGF